MGTIGTGCNSGWYLWPGPMVRFLVVTFSLYWSIPHAKDTTHASIHVAFPTYMCEPNNEVDRLDFSYMLSLIFISVMRFQYVKDERDIIFT